VRGAEALETPKDKTNMGLDFYWERRQEAEKRGKGCGQKGKEHDGELFCDETKKADHKLLKEDYLSAVLPEPLGGRKKKKMGETESRGGGQRRENGN